MKFWQNLKGRIGVAVSYLRRRHNAVKTFVQTRDNQGVIRYYDTIAIPQTMEKKLYDVRAKRYRPGGSTVEIIETVWTREQLRQHVHACC